MLKDHLEYYYQLNLYSTLQKMYQTIILGSLLLVSLYILKRVREPKKNMPPLVRYKFPIIGHTYSYLFNCEEFLKQCKAEYGDIFSLYVWGQVKTIVGKEYSQEILSRDDAFSFAVAFNRRFPGGELLKNLELSLPLLQIFFSVRRNIRIYNPALKHQDILIKHINNQVCKRLQEKDKYGDSWKRPDDFLQDIMELDGFDSNNVNCSSLADKICALLFASIHTTASGCANVFMDLASRPQYMQELYEEQLEVHKEADENGVLPFEALNNMKKLDSFVRESFRLSGHIVSLEHVVLKDYTFSNGLQVPKDRIVNIYAEDVYQDESLQGPNPKSFEPFRHVDVNASAAKIGKNYLSFGGGKHACPGRYFAINEIKFFMHNMILNYNFRTASGKIEKRRMIGPMALPSSGGIIIEKRVK
ncbi:cytochrome P450 [Rhizophagus clarus]|uniref:Cytochrome P450 n=1 Tax=Rhizophagus clarus TaxID=94130 RepID=A0A8H3KW30_9GLOM|nr:cytochrome P450 [Rhizophagus clarus]